MTRTSEPGTVDPAHGAGRPRLLHFPPDEVVEPPRSDFPVTVARYDDAVALPLTNEPGDPRYLGAVYDQFGRLVQDSERTKPNKAWVGNPSRLLDPPLHPERIRGRTFFAGHFRTAFGHVLVETIPRFWPDLDYGEFDHFLIYPTRAGRSRSRQAFPKYAVEMLRALGVDPDKAFVITDRPLVFDELVVATSAFWLKRGCNLVCAEPFHRIRDELCAEPVQLPTDSRRIYLSRSKLPPELRRARNEDQIEALMVDSGFAVVHPQRHPIAAQVQLARRAEVIAGCDGSALHIAAFAEPGTTIFSIDSRSVTNQFIVEEFSKVDAVHVFGMDHKIPERTLDWDVDIQRVHDAMRLVGLR